MVDYVNTFSDRSCYPCETMYIPRKDSEMKMIHLQEFLLNETYGGKSFEWNN